MVLTSETISQMHSLSSNQHVLVDVGRCHGHRRVATRTGQISYGGTCIKASVTFAIDYQPRTNNAITTPERTSLSWKGYDLFKITKLAFCVGALLLWLTHDNMYGVFADQDELPVCGER
jgi:hypothetical protein